MEDDKKKLSDIKRSDTGDLNIDEITRDGVKSFSEFSKPYWDLKGEKIHITQILGKDIIALQFTIVPSKHNDGECLHLQFRNCLDGKLHIVFTGSAVLIRQCREYADKFPFGCKIMKKDKYYTFE